MPNSTEAISFHYGGNAIQITPEDLTSAGLVLRALNHSLRSQIVNLLAEKEEMVVTDIYLQLKQEQSIISQQLGILRRAGIVLARKEGKFSYYRVSTRWLSDIARTINELGGAAS